VSSIQNVQIARVHLEHPYTIIAFALYRSRGILPAQHRGGVAGLQGCDWCSNRASAHADIGELALEGFSAAAEEDAQGVCPVTRHIPLTAVEPIITVAAYPTSNPTPIVGPVWRLKTWRCSFGLGTSHRG
jgi:hypothetical protein